MTLTINLTPTEEAQLTTAAQRLSPSSRPASHTGTATRPWHNAMTAWRSHICRVAESDVPSISAVRDRGDRRGYEPLAAR